MNINISLNEYAQEQLQKQNKFDFNTTKLDSQAEREDYTSLLHEISELFDRLGETSNEEKKRWVGVWLENKRYPQRTFREMPGKQLLELRADIIEVLNC